MKPEASASSTQPCRSCGVLLATRGASPGAWLSCPGCGQPVQVRGTVFARPSPIAAEGAPPSAAWSKDPRLNEPEPPLESLTAENRAGLFQIITLAGLSGIAHAMFVATFLLVVNPWEMLISWAFGAMVALFVAIMVNTMRWGGRHERRRRL